MSGCAESYCRRISAKFSLCICITNLVRLIQTSLSLFFFNGSLKFGSAEKKYKATNDVSVQPTGKWSSGLANRTRAILRLCYKIGISHIDTTFGFKT